MTTQKMMRTKPKPVPKNHRPPPQRVMLHKTVTTRIQKRETKRRTTYGCCVMTMTKCPQCKVLSNKLDKLKSLCDEQFHENERLVNQILDAKANKSSDLSFLKNQLIEVLDAVVNNRAKFLEEVRKQNECIVCMDSKLNNTNMFVPDCGHIVCTTCSEKMDKCPSCREQYPKKI